MTTTTHPQTETPVEGHLVHPSDRKYVMIALILAAITMVEIGLYYVEDSFGDATAPLLIAGSALKFFIVVAYFMHLKFDHPLLRRMFTAALVLSTIVYLVILMSMGAIFGRPSAPRPQPEPAPFVKG